MRVPLLVLLLRTVQRNGRPTQHNGTTAVDLWGALHRGPHARVSVGDKSSFLPRRHNLDQDRKIHPNAARDSPLLWRAVKRS